MDCWFLSIFSEGRTLRAKGLETLLILVAALGEGVSLILQDRQSIPLFLPLSSDLGFGFIPVMYEFLGWDMEASVDWFFVEVLDTGADHWDSSTLLERYSTPLH
jgi:hypothetical protein